MTSPTERLARITDDVILLPSEICAIQAEKKWRKEPAVSPSGNDAYHCAFDGSVITLKCGRKIYVPDLTPKQICDRIVEGKHTDEKGGGG